MCANKKPPHAGFSYNLSRKNHWRESCTGVQYRKGWEGSAPGCLTIPISSTINPESFFSKSLRLTFSYLWIKKQPVEVLLRLRELGDKLNDPIVLCQNVLLIDLPPRAYKRRAGPFFSWAGDQGTVADVEWDPVITAQ